MLGLWSSSYLLLKLMILKKSLLLLNKIELKKVTYFTINYFQDFSMVCVVCGDKFNLALHIN